MPRLITHDSDGTLSRRTYEQPDGSLQTVLSQPSRDAVMERTKQRRLAGGPRRLEWGAPVLTIPELDLFALKKKYPELASSDMETRNRAWYRFMASSEAEPYKVK